MIPSGRPDKVVIVGRDAAAWLTACALNRALGPTGVAIEVVELPSLLRPNDISAGLPALEPFHGLLGLNEAEVLKATMGTCSLGQSFANFARARPPFFHGYGVQGAPINGIAFLQIWTKARQAGLKVELEDFSLNAAAAKQGRFFIPNEEINAFGRCDFAYQLRAAAYVRLLRTLAMKGGVAVRAARGFTAGRDPETGHILSLALSDGSTVSGDLFIDATGAESLLLGGVMGVPFESWQGWFGTDRMIAVSAPRLAQLPAWSQVRAVEAGTLHLACLQDMTSLVRVFDSSAMDDEAALQSTAVIANMRLDDNAVVGPLHVGARARAWAGNVIAIGEAAAVFDAIDNVSLHGVQLGIVHLMDLFPIDRDARHERDEYNRNLASALARLRDFQIAHGKLNQIVDKPHWDGLRAMAVPDSLAWKIELFKARGQVALYDDETFEAENWQAIFVGHGLTPRAYDPMADLLPQDETIASVQRMLGFIRQQVEAMGTLDDFLKNQGVRAFA